MKTPHLGLLPWTSDQRTRPVMRVSHPCRYELRKCGFTVNRPRRVTTDFINAISDQVIWRYAVSGAATWEVGEQRVPVGPGTVLAMRQPTRGRLVAGPEGVGVLWIVLQGAAIGYLLEIVERFGQVHTLLPRSEPVRRAEELVRLTRSGRALSPFEWSERTYHFLSAWHRQLEEHRASTRTLLRAAAHDSRRLSFAPRTVKNFAAQLGYSSSYLTRRIARYWNETPGRVLRRARLEDSARLLRETAEPIHVIAGKVGYASVPAFTTAFKRHFGATPRAYRRENR